MIDRVLGYGLFVLLILGLFYNFQGDGARSYTLIGTIWSIGAGAKLLVYAKRNKLEKRKLKKVMSRVVYTK